MKCKYCDGKGFYWVPDGPDDVDREICDECEGIGTVRDSQDDYQEYERQEIEAMINKEVD